MTTNQQQFNSIELLVVVKPEEKNKKEKNKEMAPGLNDKHSHPLMNLAQLQCKS